jgi:DNA-binding transcriptional regulator YhcF (GntR family)
MEFEGNDAIYLQIAERLCDKILAKEWSSGDRLPSVRDLSIKIEVNPNTVIRSFKHLEQQKIIYKKRGIGFFVSEGAVTKIIKKRKQDFKARQAPAFFASMRQLGLEIADLIPLFDEYKIKN